MIILYEQLDKSVAIINVSDNVDIKHVIRRDVPKDVPYFVIEDSELPAEQDLAEFSNGLRANFNDESNRNIHFDILTAREITKSRLRKERIPFFEANDIKLRDAIIDSNQDQIAAAKVERDRLRDITLLPDQVSTLEELRKLHP